ncbi:class I adenylate-forming enzyme family protein [Actinocorallia populi]|uniref:class I adenylate-forming enzyme family protein n=1 Tax=Actinocorallia populi TaxID=2079200 RepID=UPI000D09290C|nr:class I adenylate-forming enzyme family protein [Actinocorallia populi]
MSEHTRGPADGGLAAFLLDHDDAADTPVLHWKDGSRTRGELIDAVKVLAGRLGPVAGRPVACLVDDGVRAITTMFAAWLAGGVYVPVNARLTDTEVRGQLLAQAPALVVTGPGQAARVPEGIGVLVEEAPGSWALLRPAADPSGPCFGEDEAVVMRTSGTTGESKPVVLSHKGVRDGIDTVIAKLRGGAARGGRPPMPNLIPTSQALWAGAWNALFSFRLGAPVILMDRFDPVEYAELVKRFALRSTILAPAMMTMLLEDSRVSDLGGLRFVRSVTAPLAPDQARAFRARFGVDVLNSYGQTELGGEVVGWTASDTREFGSAKLGAVGRAHPGVEIRILDDERGGLPAGEPGEIWIRSPFAHTADLPAGRIADGFLRTGDLGRLDADGFLWIEGRVSDMVNRGGLKIVPQEVEAALRRHPAVADACVAGVPDARLGEAPVAWVRPVAGERPEEAELLSFLRRDLAGYKVPVAVRFVADFPRTEIGKVLRRELVAGFDRSPEGSEETESR